MKILDESFSKGGSGHVRVVPDTSEDMWQLFNLLRAEDHVEAVTFRKVSRSAGADGVGPGESERIRVKLRVSVESVDYDGEGEAVRVKGRNTTETEHVKLGAYHTLDLDCGTSGEDRETRVGRRST
jgi:protein pelota